MISSLEKLKYCLELKKMRDSLNEDCTDSITLIDHLIIDLIGEINPAELMNQLVPAATPFQVPNAGQFIILSAMEIQSGVNRIKHAEGLISQLPENHSGRCTWLLNYGVGDEALKRRMNRGVSWDKRTSSVSPH